MGYQALLFCPDEKTARTVTQVLSELDFEVVSCTEPFAAVKKLMGEHFDAVVVDCDNEQNATLLFKSAHNAPNNQSALAVAVVEGQAGVAKAFRIGANLVLTKPINVEQAKGTLRVARGLLRKNESVKPATTATAKPATSAPPPPARPAHVMPTSRPPAPIAPLATTSVPAPKRTPHTNFVASASGGITETSESTDSANAVPKQIDSPLITTSKTQTVSAKIAPHAAAEAAPEITFSKTEATAPSSSGFSVATSAGSASAAAPARKAKPSISTTDKPSTAISEAENRVEKGAASASGSPVEETASPAPSFTFGDGVESGTKSAGGRSKKALVAVAAVVLIAVGGYAAWIQFGPSNRAVSAPAAVAARPVTNSAAVPQATLGTTVSPSSDVTSPASVPSSDTSIPSSTAAQLAGKTKASATTQTIAGANNVQAHQSKANSGVDSSTPEEAAVAEKAPSAGTQPIVIKKGLVQRGTGSSAASNDAPAPSIASIAPAGNGGLPNLMNGASGAPTPVLQTMSVSQGVSQGLVIKKTSPSYPANALRMRIEGSVQLLATISKTGDISAVKVLSGDQTLARAAVDAVKQWKYKPYLLDGSPVEIQTQVTVNFKLPR
jgi:TonB family protein